jgi:diguanylate cyclase (GGDEF)-like protein/PAS domain S-box-containing protein
MQEHKEPTGVAGRSETVAALDALLRVTPDAVVASMRDDGTLVPTPPSVRLYGQSAFAQVSGVDLVVFEDQLAIVDAFARAKKEPIVRVDVHLLADPDRVAKLHLFDVRAQHGVHVIVVELPSTDALQRSAAARLAMRRPVGHVKRDATGIFLEVDEATTALLGWSAEELVGHSSIEFGHAEDLERAIDNWMAMRAGTGSGRVRVRYRCADSRYLWLEIANDNRLDDPVYACVLSELTDISEEMQHLEMLQAREQLLARLAEALPIGVCHLRADRGIAYANEPFAALLGPIESIAALVDRVVAAGRPPLEAALERAFLGVEGTVHVAVMHEVGERRVELTIRALTGDDGITDGVIVCAADITERSRLREELEHRASHDALTDCLNRSATVAALERALRDAQQVAVAYVDIDRFKRVNDELGHSAGDAVLRVAAARLRSAIRTEDQLGRVGGDEFVVICARTDDPLDALLLVTRLRDAINGDVVLAGQRVALRASVGAAVSVEHELDAEALLHRADIDMYEAKRRANGP